MEKKEKYKNLPLPVHSKSEVPSGHPGLGIVWYDLVWFSMVWYGMVLYGIHGMVSDG